MEAAALLLCKPPPVPEGTNEELSCYSLILVQIEHNIKGYVSISYVSLCKIEINKCFLKMLTIFFSEKKRKKVIFQRN